MTEGLLIALIALSIVNIVIGLKREVSVDIKPQLKDVEDTILKFQTSLEQTQKSIKDEFQRNRTETNEISKINREELTKALKQFEEQFDKNVKELNKLLNEKFEVQNKQQIEFNKQTNESAKENREELSKSLKSFEESFSRNIKALNELLREKFGDFNKQQIEINKQATENIKQVEYTIEKQLKSIREDNTKQLEEILEVSDKKRIFKLEDEYFLKTQLRTPQGIIIAIQPANQLVELLRSTARLFFFVWLIGAGVILFFSFLFSSRFIRSVGSIIKKAEKISREMEGLLPEEGLSGEMLELTKSLNKMILRLRNALEDEKAFSVSAAHELKTPLANIIGYVGMLRRWGLQHEDIAYESLERIERTAIELNDLVSKFLNLNEPIDLSKTQKYRRVIFLITILMSLKTDSRIGR